MNYLDARIRGVKFQKKQIPSRNFGTNKIKYDASIGELEVNIQLITQHITFPKFETLEKFIIFQKMKP